MIRISGFGLRISPEARVSRKIAAASALIAFAVCLIQGLVAENTFATTVSRGLAAMAMTFVVGLVVGAMGEKMYEEHTKSVEKMGKSETKMAPDDR